MAKTDFAIERPRKISISILGYDAHQRVQQQQQRRKDRNQRLERKHAKASASTPVVMAPATSAPPAAPKQRDGNSAPAKEIRAAKPRPAKRPALAPAVEGHEPTLLELKLRTAFAETDAAGGQR